VDKIYALDLNITKRIVFCAGRTLSASDGATDGVLAAIQFDKGLKLIAETILVGTYIQACSSMKRTPNKDDLIVGGFKSIIVARFTGTSFEILQQINQIHSNIICDIEISRNKVYTVCRQDKHIGVTEFNQII